MFFVRSHSKLQNHLYLLYNDRAWNFCPFRPAKIKFISKPVAKQKKCWRVLFHDRCISVQHSETYNVFCGPKEPFNSRYIEILEDHQTCRKENAGRCGWRIPYKEQRMNFFRSIVICNRNHSFWGRWFSLCI